MIRLRSLLNEAKCPRCQGRRTVLSKTDKAHVQCPECGGSGKVIREAGESSQKLLKVGDKVSVDPKYPNKAMHGWTGDIIHIPAPGVQGRVARVKFPGKPIVTKDIEWDYLNKEMTEAGGDSSGSDQLGSYRSIANDDPWAARIHLANSIRQFADEVESVKNGPQIDPQQDTYDSPNIDGFIEAVTSTQKMMNSVINNWKQQVAKLDNAQPGKSLS